MGLTIGSVACFLPFVNPSQKTMGEETVVYDSVMTESMEAGNECIDLQSVGLTIGSVAHFQPFVNPSQKTMGEETVVYDSVMTESMEARNEFMLTDEFLS